MDEAVRSELRHVSDVLEDYGRDNHNMLAYGIAAGIAFATNRAAGSNEEMAGNAYKLLAATEQFFIEDAVGRLTHEA